MSRILAIDYGTRRIGLALSDPTRTLASPLPFLDAEPPNKLLEEIARLAKSNDVELILVGLPRNMDGTLGPAAQAVQAFMEELKKTTPIQIRAIDERLSTVQASRLLRQAGHDARAQKTKIDSAAAQVLLQNYLDSSI